MSYYSYDHYVHLDIDDLSKEEAQTICTRLIDLGLSFTVTNTYGNHGACYSVQIQTCSSFHIWDIEELMEELNIDIVI